MPSPRASAQLTARAGRDCGAGREGSHGASAVGSHLPRGAGPGSSSGNFGRGFWGFDLVSGLGPVGTDRKPFAPYCLGRRVLQAGGGAEGRVGGREGGAGAGVRLGADPGQGQSPARPSCCVAPSQGTASTSSTGPNMLAGFSGPGPQSAGPGGGPGRGVGLGRGRISGPQPDWGRGRGRAGAGVGARAGAGPEPRRSA